MDPVTFDHKIGYEGGLNARSFIFQPNEESPKTNVVIKDGVDKIKDKKRQGKLVTQRVIQKYKSAGGVTRDRLKAKLLAKQQ